MAGRMAGVLLEVEALRRTQRASAFRVFPGRPDGAAPLIGSTPVMRALRDRIERLAATDFTVLIEGESGTGKELVARQIHDLSPRRAGPFVAINCAALVESLLEAELFGIEERTATGVRGRRGKFEHADTGTLFLDEVSDLSLSAQAKLLRAIQELAVERVGRPGRAAGRHPDRGGDQSQPAIAGGRRRVPGRPVLPARRRRPAGAASAPSPGRHRRALAVFPRAASRDAAPGAVAGGHRCAADARVAWQRPRAAAGDRKRHLPGARRARRAGAICRRRCGGLPRQCSGRR